ncbi:ABC transporter C family member 3-like isoform X1 [Telopea speciosissima]|uniref:ABC transporter C family member 3-like isoform X1 n=1 Tax=Telopea speciosissima TaxID=54955 RepID=UPI001CC4028E|nr:ABC transporter C family member 3-like isoform X1 [Telopea speciosissima]
MSYDSVHGTTMFFPTFFTVMSSSSSSPAVLFLKPIFLHGFSASSHLVLLLVLSFYWACKRLTIPKHEGSTPGLKNIPFLYYRPALFACLSLFSFNLIFCALNYLFWCRNGWSNENIVTQLDFVLRTLAWFAISSFLHFQFHSIGLRFPILLRIWWGFYFLLSCSCLVIDVVSFEKHQFLPTQSWISDVVSVLSGLFFCYAGFFGKQRVDARLREPLLNGSNNRANGIEGPGNTIGRDSINPYSTANFLGILTFSWMGPLLAVGNKKTIDLEDVPQLATCDTVNRVFPVFRSKLESNGGNGGGSGAGRDQITTLKLVKALILSAWVEILLSGVLALIYTFASYAGPYLIDSFVQYLNSHHQHKSKGYMLVSMFFLSKLVECLSQRHWFFRLQQVGIKAHAGLVAMIYRKGLDLSNISRQGHTSGEIINFMSVDAGRIDDFGWYMHDLWLVPVQVALGLLILYKSLGLASIAALVATIIVMLANLPLGTLQEKFQMKLMGSKDQRMKATSEILKNMRILKLQGWEMKFLAKIVELRRAETGWLKKFVYTAAMTNSLYWGAPTFISVVTFVACMLLGIPLESGKILTALATFRVLQMPIYSLPDTISMVVQTKVSLDRIASFLRLDDLQADVVQKLPVGSSEIAIEIINGNFSWDPHSSILTLKEMNFHVYHGTRVAICGPVGSGKSSLLSCILGEMHKESGTVKLSGTKAYVAQSPWIQSGKIVENILFGKEMDIERYEKVLEACSLKRDLEILPFGDQTLIGERGINLSGGQKQRIQIARALYQDAEIYLFDDPFSAVDAHTGSHLFKECLLGHLGSKTVIYVTHQVEFLPSADLILVMRDGRVTQAGKYEEILSLGTDFMELVGAHKKALTAIDSMDCGTSSENLVTTKEEGNTGYSENAFQEEVEKRELINAKAEQIGQPEGQLVQAEEREKGRVDLSVYWKYITTAHKGALVPLILVAQIFFQLLQIASNYWMAWVTPVSKDVKPHVRGSTLIFVYVILALGSSLCVLARSMLTVTAGYKTATLLFNKIHLCIFRAPMSFFDSTPSGRILNRASTDQSAIDMSIPFQMGGVAFAVIQLLAIIAIMSQIAWQVCIVFIPVIAICMWYQQYYIPTARELARLVGVCKAPVIQHFAESISGSTIIRSFDQEPRFMEMNLKLIDCYSRPKFHNAGAMEWLSFRLNILSSLTFALFLVFLIAMPEGVTDPGIMGLAVTYALSLNMLQSSFIRNLCNLENNIISVERILQYTCIPSEPPLVIEVNRPAHDWPSLGKVDIVNLQVRYAPHLPLVLRGLTCTFPGGMKTGIVGRTGSGKSTLIQALFRIVEPAAGHIVIDGVDISKIGLHDLRSRLSIIPQDPTMFEGTVRNNLDPLEEHTDEQIWEALDRCQLGDEVRKNERKLDSAVTENGENWSMGQRQLVCLGRALLKSSKVLVLDEATASVDTATDNLIQHTLRQQFSESTVITIAHRITSVLASDMVLLLDNGLIVEYDSPVKLLENRSSSFTKLVAEYTQR